MQRPSGLAEQTPLILLHDEHVPWHVWGNRERGEPVVYARGYASVGEQAFENQSLSRHAHEVAIQGSQALSNQIPTWNGGWALVVAWPTGQILAAVDRMRTIPLFFYHNSASFAIAASAVSLAQRFSLPLGARAQMKFLLFGYVSGGDTLYEKVRQLQPGEIIEYRPVVENWLASTRYYRLYPTEVEFDPKQKLVEPLANIIWRMFERFRGGYRGERVAVPLSGGLDSRLIVGMLKRFGIDNCLCYTYGDESHEEVQISRQVAEALGYRWRCLPYSPDVLARFKAEQAFQAYWLYGSKGVSAPHAQDFAAVLQLAEEGFHGPETIFFPGHSADMNAGSHIPPDYPDLWTGTLNVTDEILRHHAAPSWHEPFRLLKSSEPFGVLSGIEKEAAPPPGTTKANLLACCEMWNAENRQSKYIINSVRIYEYAGARWRTLWDYEFMDFFLRVPIELRYGQKLYLDCLRERIFVDDLVPLAAISVAGQGPLKSIAALRMPPRPTSAIARYRNTIKRKLAWHRFKWGVKHPKGMANSKFEAVVRLDGFGDVPGAISFRDALARVDALPNLTPEIQKALAPWLDMRLESMSWPAVHAVLTLARMSHGSLTASRTL